MLEESSFSDKDDNKNAKNKDEGEITTNRITDIIEEDLMQNK